MEQGVLLEEAVVAERALVELDDDLVVLGDAEVGQ